MVRFAELFRDESNVVSLIQHLSRTQILADIAIGRLGCYMVGNLCPR